MTIDHITNTILLTEAISVSIAIGLWVFSNIKWPKARASRFNYTFCRGDTVISKKGGKIYYVVVNPYTVERKIGKAKSCMRISLYQDIGRGAMNTDDLVMEVDCKD